MNQLILVETVDILNHSIVVGITNSAGRRSNSVLSQALVVDNAHILSAVVSMINQARCFLGAHDRLVECLQRQGFGAHQPGCVLAANVNALAAQHTPHLPHPVDAVIFRNERREYALTKAASRRARALKPRALDWRYPREQRTPPSRCVLNVWQMNSTEQRFRYSSHLERPASIASPGAYFRFRHACVLLGDMLLQACNLRAIPKCTHGRLWQVVAMSYYGP